MGVPLLLWGLGLLLQRLSPPIGRGFHLAVVVGLAGLAALRVLRSIDALTAAVAIVMASIAGLAFAIGYITYRALRRWVHYTSVLPLVAVAAFLFASPAGELVTHRPAAAAAVAAAPPMDAPSVLFLLLDELPTSALLDEEGDIDAVRFPNLAELAEDGAWYPSYSTSSAFTVTAVPAILSGKPPTADPPIFTRHPDNLFSLLAPTHDLHVVETVTELCDPRTCRPTGSTRGATAIVSSLLADGASAYGERLLGDSTRNAFEDVELDLESTLDEHLADEFKAVQQRPHVLTELLGTIEPTDEPALWFAHLMLPHQPWVLYPDGSTYDRTDFRPGNPSEPWLRAIAEQRMLLQLQYTDALVGEALDALRRAGEYEDAIVVVTGDHGVSLVPGTPRRQLEPDTVEQLAYAPLIIKGPAGRQPEPDGSNVTSADLLPTIAALAGVDVPWELAGHPIGSQPQLRRGRTKEVYDFGSGSSPAYERTLTFELRPGGPPHDDRLIRDLQPGDLPIAGLLALLDVEPWLGRSIDDQPRGQASTTATVRRGIARFEDPGASPPGSSWRPCTETSRTMTLCSWR